MFDGSYKIFEGVKRQNTVVIIATVKNKVVVLKQKQPGTKWYLTNPAGRMDIPNEKPADAAKRELLEETGYSCSKMEKLVSFHPIVGLSPVKTNIFMATGLKKAKQNLDEDEYVSTVNVKIKDIPKLINEGKIGDARGIIGLMMLLNKNP